MPPCVRTATSLLLFGASAARFAGTPAFSVSRTLATSSARSNSGPSPKLAVRLESSPMALSNEAVRHVDGQDLPDWMMPERTRILTKQIVKPKDARKCVMYWMQRDVRTKDNWALLYAHYWAKSAQVPLVVCYVLPPSPPPFDRDEELPPRMTDLPFTKRYGSFLLGGLQHVHEELAEQSVPLYFVKPESNESVGESVCSLIDQCKPRLVVSDFSPLRQYRDWIEKQCVPLLVQRKLPMYQVDAHNVVPVWHASPKREVGARTLRPKIHKLLPCFLQAYPEFEGNSHVEDKPKIEDFSLEDCQDYLRLDPTVETVDWAKPGTQEGMAQFRAFCQRGLKDFDSLRNDPTEKDICSSLSPWINMGHVSFQKILKEVKALNRYANGTASFVEEGLVRRELSDNFVYYSPNDYDELTTAAQWAQDSLELHASDEREYLYSLKEFEQADTHDDLWNAAQLQVVQEGKLHGFLRMYWAKKILEWTPSPEVALRTAQYLNDKYALDGNDPNGFVGVGWSIMGIHDMGWKERPIFGKIRFMNYAGCKRKFKVAQFVAGYKGAAEKAQKAEAKHGKRRLSGAKRKSH